MMKPRRLFAVGSKIKPKIAKIATMLFILPVDVAFRICLFTQGFLVFLLGLVFVAPQFGIWAAVLTTFIGIAGLKVACRAWPYRYNPPYLDREIINKQNYVIPICILGIACHLYYFWPSISFLHEVYKFHPDFRLTVVLSIYGYTLGFVYAIAEKIILRRLVDGVSTSTEEKL